MKEIQTPKGGKFKYYTPKELKAHLDEYIIGQDEAKMTLCVAVYNHYKRVILSMNKSDVSIDKSNVCLIGPTGCGKTYMLKCIAEYMGVPYYIADATTLTQAGYVGDDVESILSGLLRASDYIIPLAEYGIIFIDEIDKISKKGSNNHITRDVVGEGVQQALLKMVEGSVVGVPPAEGRKHPEEQLLYVNTKNILFIGSGAFSGIEDIVSQRMNVKKIGYAISSPESDTDEFNPYEHISQEDLRQFGMIPEFIGRFPVIVTVNPLTKDDLIKIITEPKNSIFRQYDTMLKMDKINVTFSRDAYEYIAEVALSLKTGARALKAIVETVLNRYIYDYADSDGKDITIDKDDIISRLDKRYKIAE